MCPLLSPRYTVGICCFTIPYLLNSTFSYQNQLRRKCENYFTRFMLFRVYFLACYLFLKKSEITCAFLLLSSAIQRHLCTTNWFWINYEGIFYQPKKTKHYTTLPYLSELISTAHIKRSSLRRQFDDDGKEPGTQSLSSLLILARKARRPKKKA